MTNSLAPSAIRDINVWSPRLRDPFLEIMAPERLTHTWGECIDGMTKISRQRNGNICGDALPYIRCPTLIMHGGNDPMISTRRQHILCDSIPNAEYYEIENGKHNVHLRYADEFNRAVAEFLLRKVAIADS